MHSNHKPPLAAVLIVPLIAAAVLALFAWPSSRMEPRGLPLGAVGAAPVGGDAFEVHRYADEAQAREAIADREVYGAFVNGKALISTSASPVVAQMLTHAAGDAPVEDVVPASRHASALGSAVLPLVLAGLLTGALCSVLAAGLWRRLWLVLGASILCGLAGALVVQSWLGVIGGDWLANAAALSLVVASIGLVTTGLEALMGKGGIVIAALTMVLVGNPFSAVNAAPELLPRPAGDLGQLLPPGAGGNLLRSTGLFDGAAAGSHVAVLAGWALLGLGCLAAAALRERRPAAVLTASSSRA
jgi:hypothetical protein